LHFRPKNLSSQRYYASSYIFGTFSGLPTIYLKDAKKTPFFTIQRFTLPGFLKWCNLFFKAEPALKQAGLFLKISLDD